MRPVHFATVTIVIALVTTLSGCDSTIPSITTVIDVSMRPSLLDPSTSVLLLTNLTGRSLTVQLVMSNKDFNQKATLDVTIGPHKTVEIGILEGWSFVPNESVTISCSGYRSVTYHTFRTESGFTGLKKSLW